MSIPGVFSPVRDGEKIYVDGDSVGNLPTDIVRKMGADIVIAVPLDVAPANPKDIQSLFSVLGRSVDVVVHENELRGLAAADLIVNVNLHDYNSLDYNKSKTIIGLGTKAADEKRRILTPYSLDDAAWRDYLQAKRDRERHTIPTPQFVKVDGTNPQMARQMEVGDYDAKLRLGTPEFFSHAGRLGDTRLHFLTDHRDDPSFPTADTAWMEHFSGSIPTPAQTARSP